MLQVQNLSIVFGDRVLVENATFTLRPKDRVALVGKNGAGKSTLMKAIGNEQVLETGNISKPSDYTIGFLRQEIRAHKEKTLFEEARSAFEEAKRNCTKWSMRLKILPIITTQNTMI